jgi:hypothetical protein
VFAPHYESAAPVTGATEKCEVSFDFENTVTRIHEDPRNKNPILTMGRHYAGRK